MTAREDQRHAHTRNCWDEGGTVLTCSLVEDQPRPNWHKSGCLCDDCSRWRDAHRPKVETGAHPSQDAQQFWYPIALKIVRGAYEHSHRPILGNADEVEAQMLAHMLAKHAAGARSTPSLPEKFTKYLHTESGGHLLHCNGDHDGPIGGPGCVCSPLRLQREIERLRAELERRDPTREAAVALLVERAEKAEKELADRGSTPSPDPPPPEIKPSDLIGITRAAFDQLCNDNSALKAEIGQTALERDSYKFLRDCTRSALERVLHNFELLLAQKPVRDAAETISEARAALAPSLPTKKEGL